MRLHYCYHSYKYDVSHVDGVERISSEQEQLKQQQEPQQQQATMATKGVWQLKQVTIRYCQHSGSSRNVRCVGASL